MMRWEGRFAALALLAALSGCSGMRAAAPATSRNQGAGAATASDANPSAQSPATDAAGTQPPETAQSGAPQSEAPEPGANSQPATANAAVPTCVPPETRPKPKYRPKPKPVRQEAPPQLPTAPAVAETPAGGVVDARVEKMPVAVMSILGKRVKGPHGDDLGRVVDVLADASGRVRIAIIDFGGFLGVGDRRIAVDWPLLRFNTDGGDPSLLLSVDRDKLKTAPEYKDMARPETLMEPDAGAAAAPAASPASPAVATQADIKK